MPLFVIYLLKLSISLAEVWLFYQLVLRRLTFYGWNRWYLLGYAALAFFIPAVNVAKVVEASHLGSTAIMRYIPVIGDPKNIQAPRPIPVAASVHLGGFTSWDWLLAVLALGSAILLIRLLVRWVSLSRLRRRSTLIGNMGISAVKIYQVEGRIVPFSFGDAIYINRRQHSEKEWEEIILHEYVHIRQRHTVDILLAEWLCILNWYNPFAWLIRHCIRQNLEFIADSKVLENGHDKKGYQYHLLQVIGESRYRLANNFNFSSLKKRIIMMNKIKTAPLHLVKFLFVLPLLAVLLVAFRSWHGAARANSTAMPLETIAAQISASQTTDAEVTHSAAAGDSIPSSTDANREGPARRAPMGVIPPGMRPHPDSLHQPLYFVDGVESVNGKDPQGAPLNKMNPFDIDRIDVLGRDSAFKVYGEKARYGAIFIYRRYQAKDPISHVPAAAGKDNKITVFTVDKAKVNVTLMGKDTVSITGSSAVIQPIDTMGSAHAYARNDTYIVGYLNQDSLLVANRNTPRDKDGRARPASMTVVGSYKGLIILNGKAISAKELNGLDISKVIHFEIHMGNEEAVKQYGELARDEVILVTTK